ncbi:hypothetical protein C6341_g9675 [Phytophthora cactorum]|nr:hypothetical protein C6341_g9675 [Phytophthora cactorum]
MPRGKQLSVEECRKIDMHVRERRSNRAIAKLLGRDEKAIRNYLRRGKASSATKRTGRKPKLTEREVRRVFRLAIANGLSANQIRNKLPSLPSTSTVLRTLCSRSYMRYAKRKPTPALKPHHKKKRVAFAEKYASKRKFWRAVVFTDEKKFNLDGPDGFRFYWHDMRAEPKFISKRVNGGGSVMIWAGISWYGKTELIFLNGKQNAVKYTETLSKGLLPYLGELRLKIGNLRPIFQQDNASIHSARFTKTFLEINNVETLPWPAKSPDLNIIENVWGVLACRVYANGRQFDTKTDLMRQIKAEWEKINLEYLHKLVRSIPKRLEATRLLKGSKTGY